MIKVLHFASIINRYDFIDTVLTSLDKSEFNVSALTVIPARRLGSYTAEEAYPVNCLDIAFEKKNYIKILKALIREIKRFQPDIIQSHHYNETILTWFALKMVKTKGWVIGHHYSDHIYQLSKGIKQKVLLFGEKKCNDRAGKIIVPAQEVYDLLLKKQKVDSGKLRVIPYGVDLLQADNIDPAAINNIRSEYKLEGKFVALTSCRLNKEKGLDYLLHAVAKLVKEKKDFKLIMLGDGPEKQHLEKLIDELQIADYVSMPGWRNDVMNWMKMADVVVQPSLSESFCQVLTESLLLETPVIMTPVGAAPEIIGNNERGIIINIADADSIYKALKALIDDSLLGEKMGKAGKLFIENNLGVKATASQYGQVYKSIVF